MTARPTPRPATSPSLLPQDCSATMAGSDPHADVEDFVFPDTPARGAISGTNNSAYRVEDRGEKRILPGGLPLDGRIDVVPAGSYAVGTCTYFGSPT